MALEFAANSLSIRWGDGGFGRDDWLFVYRLIRKYRVQSVLEYGCGLSTELMTAIGLRVLSVETRGHFANLYKDFNVQHCHYDKYPQLAEKFDLAFVDGPGEKERPDRSKAIIHAKQYCKYLYLHDYDLYQFGYLEGDPDWVQCRPYGKYHNHFFIRRDTLIA